MTKILTPLAEFDVAARDGLWMSPVDATKVTGWTLKPAGWHQTSVKARSTHVARGAI